MAYIGNIPAEAYISISSQTFTTINGTGYTLSSSVESSEDIALFLNNVRQKPSTYTATGTSLTMGTATTTADELYCVYLGKALQTVNPGADSVGTSQIADDAVTTAKIADLNVTVGKLPASVDLSTKTVTLPASVSGLGTGITNAQLAGSIDVTSKITGVVPTANLGSGTASSSTYLAGDQTYKTISEYDDNVLQSNVAMLGFKVATNGSLAKYNLVDQIVDDYNDASGIDAAASTNENRVDNAYHGGTSDTVTVTDDADSTTTDGDYTIYKWTGTGSGSYSQDVAQADIDWLVVAGGGPGGHANPGGGGGAGGLRTSYGSASGGGSAVESKLSFGAGTSYTITVGAGGTGNTSHNPGYGPKGGDSSISGSDITDITSDGGGAGSGYYANPNNDGGSGGGGGDPNGSTTTGGTGTANQGYAGGNAGAASGSDSTQAGGGGGGAAGVGAVGVYNVEGGAGGAGLDISITGASVGYGGGGGGGCDITGGAGTHGGGNGGTSATAGAANTGGGGGGMSGTPKDGGSGVVILRRLTSPIAGGANLTLQSTDTTASAQPDNADMVMLLENKYGTNTLNTDIKGYISRDSGATFTQGTLVDEGTWGTNKQIIAFHDLDISAQPAGTSMCYKIETLNQAEASKEAYIHATSMGWR